MESEYPRGRVEALADSGSSVSILSLDLAEKIKLKLRGRRSATLKDASSNKVQVG